MKFWGILNAERRVEELNTQSVSKSGKARDDKHDKFDQIHGATNTKRKKIVDG